MRAPPGRAGAGYRLAVVGRADPTGNAEANRRPSARRAVAVREFLIESCGVPPLYFVSPAALGESPVTQNPDPAKNDAEARRVSVTILVSKASVPASN